VKALVLPFLVIVPAASLTAQSDTRIASAVQLAQTGRMDSARAVVRRLLSTLSPVDTTYPEALYFAGVFAPDAQTVATHLQRVVIEYGRSAWADDALLRLTQLYEAQGDAMATTQAAERLRRDYPESPLVPRADFAGARAYFTLKDDAHGCALIREALAANALDVEFRNQVAFYSARCAGVGAAAPAAPPDTEPGARPATPAAAPAPKSFAVQVLAVRSTSQVDDMLTRLKVMGYEARVVRDTSGLFKVRVGRYTTREQAQRAQSNLRTRLGGQPFVIEEP
jgi:hypothetical protein